MSGLPEAVSQPLSPLRGSTQFFYVTLYPGLARTPPRTKAARAGDPAIRPGLTSPPPPSGWSCRKFRSPSPTAISQVELTLSLFRLGLTIFCALRAEECQDFRPGPTLCRPPRGLFPRLYSRRDRAK